MPKHSTGPAEEIFEAIKERSHRTIGGIEVVEYDQAVGDQIDAPSDAMEETVSPEAEPATDEPVVQGEPGLEWLQRECGRLTDKLARAREQLDAQKKDHLGRTSKLVLQVNTLQAELREREAQIERLDATCESLRQRLDKDLEGRLGVVSGAIEQHHAESDLASRLKERLDESGRALKLARQEISALHKERDEKAAALAERTRQVAQLLEQVAQAEIQHGFGMDFRSSLKRLFQRYPALATGSGGLEAWESQYSGIATVALDSPPDDTGSHGAADDHAGGAGETRITSNPEVDGQKGPDATLQRFLLPVRAGMGSVFELTGPRAYVGRGIAADVRISHPSVSRLHGVLFCIGGATIVEDARSTNGIYLNGRRIDQSVLKDGDVVAFGSVEFRFRVAVPED